MNNILAVYTFYYFIISSLLRFIFVVIDSRISPKKQAEIRVRILVNCSAVLDLFHLLLAILAFEHTKVYFVTNFLYFGLDLTVSWTCLSLIFLCFSFVVLNIVARFSLYYLHRDQYYYKFFSLLYILQMGLCLIILTVSYESIFVGWELLGLSSVLLIAFYDHRMSVLKNSLRVLVIYKVADIIFYTTLIFCASMGVENYTQVTSSYAVLAIFVACLIKSSVFPWFWLPRAMEGPTSSSAIFYGGLATHIPVYLILSILLHSSIALPQLASWILIGLIAFYSTGAGLLSRQMNDAKNSIAYAGIAQLGIIYIEILFGFYHFAIFHCVVHGLFRTFEFLKAPSQISLKHSIEQTAQKWIDSTGVHYEHLLPKKIRQRLYQFTYHEFYLPKMLMTWIDIFLALDTASINQRALNAYFAFTLGLLLSIHCVVTFFMGTRLSFLEEGLLIAAYLFNLLAMMNKYVPSRFFIAITLSVLIVLNLLTEKIYPEMRWVTYVYPALLLAFFYQVFQKRSVSHESLNYTGRIETPRFWSNMILVVGLAIIGAPGLGTFFVWERLEHLVLFSNPNLIIETFLILTLNTIAFFRFFYANYLGRLDGKIQYETIFRD